MTTPRGAPYLTQSQAIPEATVNEQVLHVGAGAEHYAVADKDLTAPPGTCADGARYIVAATATGLWAGEENNIAIAVGTDAASGWLFAVPVEGTTAYLQDENARYLFDGSAWGVDGSSGASGDTLTPCFNFTDDGEARLYAYEAMTLTEQDTSGTGSVAYEKSTTAAPGTFSSTSSPITLEAGAWLKVTATSVSSIYAVALKRTA